MTSTPLRVLYVEDNPVDADLTRRELARLAPQIRLEVVTTLEAALEQLAPEAPPFEVVLTDLKLPDGSGLDLLSRVRERGLPLAVVIITGHGDEDAAVAALKAGADDYLVKRAELYSTLPRALAAAHQGSMQRRERLSLPLFVLYAEPNAADVDLTRRYLARHAPYIHLEVVGSGTELLTRLPEKAEEAAPPCDVLLLDFKLPGLDALEIVKSVRQERGLDLPIVLVTGRGSEELAVRALRMGVDDYLVKQEGYLRQLPSVLEKVQKQAELNKSEKRYRTLSQEFHGLLDAIPDSLMLLDSELKVLWRNRAGAEEIAAAAAETPFGAPCYSQCYLRTRPCVRCPVTGSFHSGLPAEATIEGHDGKIWNVRTVPLRNEAGKVTRVIELKRDITEKRKAEEALRESEQKYRQLSEVLEQRVRETVDELRQKDQLLILQGRQAVLGEMISNIAHQWRQPLNMLALLAQELQMSQKKNELSGELLQGNVARSLEIIKEMSKTIDYFRFFFRPEEKTSDFRILDTLEKTVSLLDGSFRMHGIRIDLQVTDDPAVNGYLTDFVQVLLNILINARDALVAAKPADPLIGIRLYSEGEAAVVTIADNAGGIPEEILDRVFDPYFTTKGPKQGAGIGLFMCKTIIEKNMGGSLSVSNVGAGAQFRISVSRLMYSGA